MNLTLAAVAVFALLAAVLMAYLYGKETGRRLERDAELAARQAIEGRVGVPAELAGEAAADSPTADLIHRYDPEDRTGREVPP